MVQFETIQSNRNMDTVVLSCGGCKVSGIDANASGILCRVKSKGTALLAEGSWDAEANVIACRVPTVRVYVLRGGGHRTFERLVLLHIVASLSPLFTDETGPRDARPGL